MMEPDDWAALNRGKTTVTDGFAVDAFEIGHQIEDLAWEGSFEKFNGAGDAGDRTAREIDRGHGGPGGELADGFADERGGKIRQGGRDDVRAADPASRLN